MSKALIVGAAGFVGSYLARELKNNHGMEVHATKLAHEQLEIPGVAIHDLNILNKDEIVALLYEVRPDYIFHLAAQSSVSVAWKNPGLTIDINVKGSVNLMDAVRELFYKPRVLLIGSGEEYGHIREGETPIKEDNYLRPGNIYAATKVCQNMIASIYTQAYDGPGIQPHRSLPVADLCHLGFLQTGSGDRGGKERTRDVCRKSGGKAGFYGCA